MTRRDQSAMAEALAEFHTALGDKRGRGNAALRATLHQEEHRELLDELIDPSHSAFAKSDHEVDRHQLARELADVVYIAFGTAHAFDIDLDAALGEVHRAAMSKVEPTCSDCVEGKTHDVLEGQPVVEACASCGGSGKGERIERDDGKVLKPPGFVPPDMTGAVR